MYDFMCIFVMREMENFTILCRCIETGNLASFSIEWAGKPENRFLSKNLKFGGIHYSPDPLPLGLQLNTSSFGLLNFVF